MGHHRIPTLNAMAELPVDMITCILSRLPAKCVLICKSVCKLWYDLIDSPEFVNIHLERTLATQSNLQVVVRSPGLYLADFDTFDNPIDLDYPFKHPDHGGAAVVGSCRGLLCLQSYDFFHISLFLYNPTTRTHKILPFPEEPNFECSSYDLTFGFGYDNFSGDYKCVRILQKFYKETNSFDSQFMVYSLKTDSWRWVQDVPYYFHCHHGGCAHVGGALHWVGEDDNRVFVPIVRFDLKEETFSSIALPKFYDYDYVHMSVGVIEECLCLMVNYVYYSEVWILREYCGMPGSWMRWLHVVKRKGYEHLERPIAFSRSRKELFMMVCLYRVVKLDLETRVVSDVQVGDLRRCLDAWVCVENLLVLNDTYDDDFGSEEEWRKAKKSKKKKKRRKGRKNRRG